MGSPAVWYRRFADIPGVHYQGDDARRSRLVDRDAVPEVVREDRRRNDPPMLWWETRTSRGSQSPASAMASRVPDKASSAQARECLLSALELPGTPSDYHFAIQALIER